MLVCVNAHDCRSRWTGRRRKWASRTGSLANDGVNVSGADRLALGALLEEVVGTTVVDVSVGTGGHGRKSGSSDSTLHVESNSPESDISVVFFCDYSRVVTRIGNECPLKE